MSACHKLYPSAQPVLVSGVDDNVKEFLSLYGNVFNFQNIGDVDLSNVKTLIITDTGHTGKVGKKIADLLVDEKLRVIVYDHHVSEDRDFRIDEFHVENYGAATTVVMAEILKSNFPVDPIEATLYALGIYEDTGNLTFSSTTPRDLEVVGELIKFGARLDIVTKYLSQTLDPSQRQLLQKMLLNVREMQINGRTISFTTAKMSMWVKEIALLVHKVREMENADVLFAVVEIKDKLYVVGRSRLSSVNVAEVLGSFGGGGHHAAASAVIPDGKINRILPSLVDAIRDIVPEGINARDIMSSPVATIDPNETIRQAYDMMMRKGHSGLVVIDVEKDDIAGIVSRKDVDKAIAHQLGHAPVKSIMSRDILTVNEETSLDEMQDLVIMHNVGRLPVMFGGKISGIVTRSDILRAIHQQIHQGPSNRMLSEEERKILLNLDRLPDEFRNYIRLAGELGDKLGYQVYLVGGMVRDLILGRENLDVDLLVEGCSDSFAKEFGMLFNAKIDINERFGTAKIHVKDTSHIDIALCRCEFYQSPGALPDITPSGLRDDLYRRDFTINALAIKLNTSGFAKLIDYFRGVNDLEERRLRTLHPLSFVDDPTRIFRAIRFEGRIGFLMDDETHRQAKTALEEDILREIAPERIRHEIELILRENNPASIILRGDEIKLWKRIDNAIKIDSTILSPVDLINKGYDRWCNDSDTQRWRAYLPVLFANLSEKSLIKLLEAMNFQHEAEQILRSVAFDARDVVAQLEGIDVNNVRKYVPVLSKLRPEALVFLWALKRDNKAIIGLIEKYMDELRHIKLEIDGDDLINLGHKPSPLFKEAFRETYFLKLEGKLTGKQNELDFAHKRLTELEQEAVN
jgi:tRNA nucleotidyltransferase (CCA-adding enzyme)